MIYTLIFVLYIVIPAGRLVNSLFNSVNGSSPYLFQYKIDKIAGVQYNLPILKKEAAFTAKILIVEDDEVIAAAIKNHLSGWGNECECITDFRNVLTSFIHFSPQLVLMDIVLPFFNGYHWCSEIRKISKVPIVFISSASDSMNIIMAVNMGGDDFIAKPFDLSVLTAKIQALLRRTYDFSGSMNIIEHAGLILNISEGSFSYSGEKYVLTRNEFRILQVLMENNGKIVSRDTLMQKLWETDSYVDENTLTVNVARLRKTLSDAGLTDYILTKKGAGYMVE